MRKWKSLTLSLGGVELRGNRQKEARYKVCHRCGLLEGVLHIAITLGKAILIVFFLEWVATNAWLKVPTHCVGERGKSQLWQLMVSRYKLSMLHMRFFCLMSICSLIPKTKAWSWLLVLLIQVPVPKKTPLTVLQAWFWTCKDAVHFFIVI